jgi:hypothetical protein
VKGQEVALGDGETVCDRVSDTDTVDEMDLVQGQLVACAEGETVSDRVRDVEIVGVVSWEAGTVAGAEGETVIDGVCVACIDGGTVVLGVCDTVIEVVRDNEPVGVIDLE